MAGRRRRFRQWIVGCVAVLLVVALGGPLIYNHFIAGPAPAMLALPTAQATGAESLSGPNLDGVWNLGARTVVGYRVPTDALGYRDTVVERTSKVSGSITISSTSVDKGSFTVNMADLAAGNSSARKILDVSVYPTATFVLRRPIENLDTSASRTIHHYPVTGKLTVHGTTRLLTFTVSEERIGSTIYVLADIPMTFSDWHISVPFGVGSAGTLEVLLSLVHGTGNPA